MMTVRKGNFQEHKAKLPITTSVDTANHLARIKGHNSRVVGAIRPIIWPRHWAHKYFNWASSRKLLDKNFSDLHTEL